ncbi:MAG: tol-pal system protein YbgF [Desulfamplus sp.]|nr:tol-pal system protein YbgF [Desulfamplus sp.]
MNQISRLSLIVILFSVSLLVASCAVPAKTGRSVTTGSGETQTDQNMAVRETKPLKLTAQNHELIHQRIEQRLDRIESILRNIEKIVGFDSASLQIEPSDSINISEQTLDEDDGITSYDDTTEPPMNSEDSTYNEGAIASASPEKLYGKARRLLIDKKFKDAEKEFKSLEQRYPSHPLAVNALYWMGECRYSIKDYKGSITIFKQLVEKYPNGRKVPDALLKTAYAYLSMSDTDNAKEYLKKVVMQFPFSPAGEKAAKKLQSFR